MKIFRKTLLWIFVGLLSLGQLQRIELQQYSIAFYLHDVLILFWVFHTLITYQKKFIEYLSQFFNQNKKTQIFASITLVSLIINAVISSDIISLFYSLRLIAYITFGFSLDFLIKNKKINAEYLKFQIFSIGFLSLILGFIQYVFIKDTRFLSILGWDDHYARLISTYFDPGFTGIIFIITLFIGLSSKYITNNIIKLLLIVSFTWGIILTFSRASYLSLITGFLIIILPELKINKLKINKLKNNRLTLNNHFTKKILIGGLLFLTLVVLAPKPYGEGVDLLRTSTIKARYLSFTQQLNNLNPKVLIIGNGPFSEKNSLNYISEKKNNQGGENLVEKENNSINQNNLIPSHSRVPDNIFINVLLSTGIFGLLFFVLVLFDWAKKLKTKNLFIYASFIALLVHTQFNSSLIQPFVILIFLSGVASLKSTN